MLPLTIPAVEAWDEQNEIFVELEKEVTLQLEHSLVSLRKWESKWNKPFLTKTKKTREEILDYIRCMTLTQNVNPKVYSRISDRLIDKVYEYIDAPMTATTFSKNAGNKGGSRETTTAELIYYWMISLNIPFECQKWHLNSLLTLIQVCNVKNSPRKNKKMSNNDLMNRNALNAARRKQYNTRG